VSAERDQRVKMLVTGGCGICENLSQSLEDQEFFRYLRTRFEITD